LELNSINLAVRFLLEIAGLVAIGVWGWNQDEGALGVVLALAIPMIAAAIWGTFAVPNDPSRSGNAPIPVPGVVRLMLELAFFASAVGSLFALSHPMLAWAFGIVVLVHYAVSYKRIMWLIRQ
jgi:hypothetical protein